ncbi:LINE-1 retrotransposable element ORF2 protein [Labeo rohita]|uniref:LINE-1 retrotransposable element ORF2 protein n=1 Tax=Labeo rohita TaxID=84645 RepID=A0ABQ8KYU1_LABRO|nr:LINE-1 retrotransposable element ORF2 protein [Labeo rohita]
MLTRTNKDFSNSAALCFTETWLNDAIPAGALHLPGYQLFGADRDAESTGKLRGSGTCFYINERWCTDVTVLNKMCCSDLEALFINCKPFYSPREFCSFILVSVYIPPQANVSLALQKLADQIADMEQKHPDSVLIILGDFNKANLSRELPKYSQHVTCPTRDSNILDHCYTTVKNAYHSAPRAALGLSAHCLLHLIPTYRQKPKTAKPVLKTARRWTNETERVLQACFEWIDWSVSEAAANDLDELTETISEDEVPQVFRKNKRRKAPGPDGVTPACLKTCADQLAPIFSQIFNRSLELCEVPSCFKRSTIIPSQRKPR